MLTMKITGNGIPRLEKAIEALGEVKARNAYRRAVNEAGRDTRTPVKNALAKQTGLKSGVAHRALKVTKASNAKLEYTLTGQGGDIALKHFAARETRKGVSAAPWGQRKVFPHTFIKGGLFPGRKKLDMGQHAFMPNQHLTKWGRKFTKAKSGVIIPNEMVQGATAEVFEKTGSTKLEQKVHEHIRKVTSGVLS